MQNDTIYYIKKGVFNLEKKTDTIIIRVSPEQKNDMKKAAGELGLNLSTYLVYLYNKFGKNE